MLQCYIKKTTNIDLLKPKVMKLTYIRKVAFNINGTIMHFTFAIQLNIFLINFFNEVKALNDEKYDTLTKTYDQFQLKVIMKCF
jgi:hypothetical protein